MYDSISVCGIISLLIQMCSIEKEISVSGDVVPCKKFYP